MYREHKMIGVVLGLPEKCFPSREKAREEAWREMRRSARELLESPWASAEWLDEAGGGQVLVSTDTEGHRVTLARVWPAYPSEANQQDRLVMRLIREAKRLVQKTYDGVMTPEDRDRLERAIDAVEKHKEVSGERSESVERNG